MQDFSYESLTADADAVMRHLVAESDKAVLPADKFKALHMATGAYSAWVMVVSSRFPALVSSLDNVRFAQLVRFTAPPADVQILPP